MVSTAGSSRQKQHSKIGRNRSYFPSWQSYKTKESSSLLEIIVSPFELKSKQLILSEFSRNTLATLKLRSTLSVSFMMACLSLRGSRPSFYTGNRPTDVPNGVSGRYINGSGAKCYFRRSVIQNRRRKPACDTSDSREGKAPPSTRR